MNKEQIQQKFEEILKGLGWSFREDGTLKERYTLQEDVEELMESCFNLGLEVAANNAETDYNMVGSWDIQKMGDIEVYILKNSILKFKL